MAAGAVFALNGYLGLTLGTLVSFLTLNKNSTQPVSQISQQMNSIAMAMAGARRIFDLMDEESETDSGYVELVNAEENPDGSLCETSERTGLWAWKHPHKADGTVTYQRLEGSITFHDVDFGYEEGKIVLHNIELYAAPGQKIAFVGSTGAGKTTITNLINRFYDIADGKIRYDGININKIKKGDLRRSLGMVLQDTHLFTGTVMENIRYGRPDASDEACIAAAKLANADGSPPSRRVPDGAHRRRGEFEPGPETASRHCQGGRGGSAGSDFGRGHILHRYPDRGPGTAGHGQPDGRAHHLCHRSPAVHGQKFGLYYGSGAGPHH